MAHFHIYPDSKSALHTASYACNFRQLLRYMDYYSDLLDPGDFIRILIGFWTDFASVPRLLPIMYAWLSGKFRGPATLHDFTYRDDATTVKGMPISKELGDDLLYESCLVWRPDCPVAAWSMYQGVRVGGHSSYGKKGILWVPEFYLQIKEGDL